MAFSIFFYDNLECKHTVDRLQTIGVYEQRTVSLSTNDLMFLKNIKVFEINIEVIKIA